MTDFVKTAWNIQNRFEDRVFRLKNMVSRELEKCVFKINDKVLFFSIFLICYLTGTFILFQVEVYKSFSTDYWILPFGVGTVSLFFTMMCSEEVR